MNDTTSDLLNTSPKGAPNETNNLSVQGLRYPAEYWQFVAWIVTPKPFRKPAFQKDLAAQLALGEDVLSDWKRRDGFWDDVRKQHKITLREDTAFVLQRLYSKALAGGAAEVKLWLQYVEEWTPPKEVKPRIYEIFYNNSV